MRLQCLTGINWLPNIREIEPHEINGLRGWRRDTGEKERYVRDVRSTNTVACRSPTPALGSRRRFTEDIRPRPDRDPAHRHSPSAQPRNVGAPGLAPLPRLTRASKVSR